jgi:hypothetical protein
VKTNVCAASVRECSRILETIEIALVGAVHYVCEVSRIVTRPFVMIGGVEWQDGLRTQYLSGIHVVEHLVEVMCKCFNFCPRGLE